MRMKRVCVRYQEPSVHTETFIKYHLDNLYAEIIPLTGYNYIIEPRMNIGYLTNYILRFYYKFFLINSIYHDFQSFLVERYLKLKKVDVILCEYGHLGNQILPVAKNMGIQLVVYFRGYDFYKRSFTKSFANNPFSYSSLLAECHRFICVSQDIALGLSKAGCSQSKIIWSPSGADEFFLNVKPFFDELNVLSIGRFAPNKGHQDSIRAIHLLAEWGRKVKFTIVGDGEERDMCINLAKELNIIDRIQFIERLDKEGIREKMEETYLFLHLSNVALDGDCEGTPNVVLEACAAGLPVVATRNGGIPDIVVHSVTGFLVDEFDYRDAAYRMEELFVSRGKAIKMGNSGRERIKDKFTRKHNLLKTEEALGITRCVE